MKRNMVPLPLWVLIEFFSMGMLSYFFSDMKRADKKALVKIWTITDPIGK